VCKKSGYSFFRWTLDFLWSMQELREGNVHMEEKRGPRFCGTSFSIAELELIGNHRRLAPDSAAPTGKHHL